MKKYRIDIVKDQKVIMTETVKVSGSDDAMVIGWDLMKSHDADDYWVTRI